MIDSKRGLKIGVWDIETTDLDGFWGEVLCVVIKTFGKAEMHSFRIDKFKSEKDLLKKVVSKLDEYDLLVGWNTSGFDFPFINTRCLIHGIKPPLRKFRRDLLYCARGNLRLQSFKLKNVSRNVIGRTRKTETTPKIKKGLITHNKIDMDFIEDHCIKDVKDTEAIYKRLMPLLGQKLRIK